MKILVVASGNHGKVAPFITEQVDALRQAGLEVKILLIQGKGICGYLGNLPALKATIGEFQPDIVHAHYGLCGLLCTLQHRVPVIITYHGSDINNRRVLPLSRIAAHRAAHNIFVSQKLLLKAHILSNHTTVLPCGINYADFPVVERATARQQMGLAVEGCYVLFAGAFDNHVKNAPLAKAAVALLPQTTLLEFSGYNREQVALMLNACDCLLMTSISEGSPQVVKEALACNLPIVSVAVGDVAELIEGIPGCYIAPRDPLALSECLRKSTEEKRPEIRAKAQTRVLDNSCVAQRLNEIYHAITQSHD